MAKSSRIEILLSAKDTGLRAALKTGQAELRTFAARVGEATRPLGSLVSGALSLKTALAGLAGGVGVTALSRSLLEAGQNMDALNRGFQAVAGQQAGAEMGYVRQTAHELGLDLVSTADAYKQLSAAAMGTALQGKPTQEVFTAMSQAATSLGLSTDAANGAFTALGQMMSKGKVAAEELRGQLGERLPGAFNLAATAMGVSTAELDKMLSAGQVMADDFLPKFATVLKERFGGSAAAAANSFTGAGNRIRSQLDLLKASLGQSVTNNQFFVEAMQKAATFLGDFSGDIEKNGASWRQWAKESALSVLQFVADTSEGLDSVYRALQGLSGTLKLSYAGALMLGQGFQFLFEQANKVAGNTDKVAYWAQAQKDAAAMIEQAMAGANQSFENAANGSTKLQGVTEKIQRLKGELAQIEAKPVTELATEVGQAADTVHTNIQEAAAATEERLVRVGNVWTNVTVAAEQNSAKAGQALATEVGKAADTVQTKIQEAVKVEPPPDGDWGKVWAAMESGSTKAGQNLTSNWDATWDRWLASGSEDVAALESQLQQLARDREVTLTITEQVKKQTGGPVQRFATGGRLPGYGGGDRIPALLEAGEYIIRKEAVSRFGSGLFAALNSLRLPEWPRFATGGAVGGAAAVSAAPVVHELRLGGARLQGGAGDVAEFIRQLEMAGLTA